ncbi:MAG: hypothetical protein R2852_08740 [Bacteroidia bacterium]
MLSSLYIVIFSIFTLSPNVGDVQSARAYYGKASEHKSFTDSLFNLTKDKNQALMKAYHGCAWALKTKHHINPYKKLEYLKKGLELINSAVLLNAADIEIRYLRFSVEENIPSVVSFKSHLEADKAMLLKNLNKTHPNYTNIRAYLKQSKTLTAAEKAGLP